MALSSANYSASEGDEVASVSVELTGAAEREVMVYIHSWDRTATGSSEEWLELAASVM